MRSLGLIGFGDFGRFITPWLTPHFHIIVYDVRDVTAAATAVGSHAATLREAAACDIVVLAVPVQALEAVLCEVTPFLRPSALVLDVASVKMRPVTLLRQYLPDHVSAVGLHPLFGPQSGRDGIAGLSVVVCPIRPADPVRVRRFLTEQLGLTVMVQTPEAHDRTMAHVQALTHFVAAVLARMDLPAYPVVTPSYTSLRRVVELLHADARELFLAIQHENPFAAVVRDQFVRIVAEVRAEVDEQGNGQPIAPWKPSP
jgi:prephenate dehydrogenase